MKFICAINDHCHGRAAMRKCKEQFDTLEALLEHIKKNHSTALGRGWKGKK